MYINTTTSAYPLSERDIREAFPNTSFPSPFVPPAGYAYVFPAPVPAYDQGTQACHEGAPVLTQIGHWEQTWVVTALAGDVVAANLAAAKTAKNLEINDWRDQADQTYFTHSGKQIDCDSLSARSIDKIAGTISMTGGFPPGFPGAWKAKDNSYLMLPDVAAFKAMYASMVTQGLVNFGRAQTLKTSLAAATTLEQVNALVWS